MIAMTTSSFTQVKTFRQARKEREHIRIAITFLTEGPSLLENPLSIARKHDFSVIILAFGVGTLDSPHFSRRRHVRHPGCCLTCSSCCSAHLRDKLLHDLAANIGETKTAAFIPEGELLVVDAQTEKKRGV